MRLIDHIRMYDLYITRLMLGCRSCKKLMSFAGICAYPLNINAWPWQHCTLESLKLSSEVILKAQNEINWFLLIFSFLHCTFIQSLWMKSVQREMFNQCMKTMHFCFWKPNIYLQFLCNKIMFLIHLWIHVLIFSCYEVMKIKIVFFQAFTIGMIVHYTIS